MKISNLIGGSTMKGKVNMNFKIEENNEFLEYCNIDIYIECLNEETMEKVRTGIKEVCVDFCNVIKHDKNN